MDYTQSILTVNSSCIVILMLLTFILLIATRFRGENGYAAAIIVLPNVPVYLYNMSRMLGWHDFTLFLFPISYSVNTLLCPLLWLFTYKNFSPHFKIRPLQLIHFIPAILCLVLCLSMSVPERLEAIQHEMTGEDTWIGDVNTLIIIAQLLIYFPMMFIYIYRRCKAIGDNTSDSAWVQKMWIPRLVGLFAGLFVVVMTCYVIWPRTDAWLIQILNVIAMSYLVYNSIANPVIPIETLTEEAPKLDEAAPSDAVTEVVEEVKEASVGSTLSDEQMSEVCNKALDYLQSTRSFLCADITLAELAKDVGIPQRTLSRSINGYRHCNFFEFINEMRVEEAKRCLLQLDSTGYNIDSIYAECGFRSRSTFFMVFKKHTGKTPASWLKEHT